MTWLVAGGTKRAQTYCAKLTRWAWQACCLKGVWLFARQTRSADPTIANLIDVTRITEGRKGLESARSSDRARVLVALINCCGYRVHSCVYSCIGNSDLRSCRDGQGCSDGCLIVGKLAVMDRYWHSTREVSSSTLATADVQQTLLPNCYVYRAAI